MNTIQYSSNVIIITNFHFFIDDTSYSNILAIAAQNAEIYPSMYIIIHIFLTQ